MRAGNESKMVCKGPIACLKYAKGDEYHSNLFQIVQTYKLLMIFQSVKMFFLLSMNLL